MQRIAVFVTTLFLGLLPLLAAAQTSTDPSKSFAFCTVTDTGSAQAKIWASPVFEFNLAYADASAFTRLNAVAGEFLQHVATLGGAGDKNCTALATRAEAEAEREEQRAIWDKRMYFIKIGDWREVNWTPAPWDPNKAVAMPAQLTKSFRCYNTQVNIPDRSDLSRTVTSRVFSMPVPGNDPVAMHTQAQTYADEFMRIVQAHGLPAEGTMCVPYDTAAEADKAQRDYRKLFSGFNQKYTEVPWQPAATAAAAANPEPRITLKPEQERTAVTAAAIPAVTPAVAAPAVVEPAPAITTAPGGGQYCAAFVMRSKAPLTVRTKIWEMPASQATHKGMTDSLSALATAVVQANPGKWQTFPPIQCYDNSAIFAGETFCVTTLYKHFSGSQMAAQFCSTSKDSIDKRWQDMLKADGPDVQFLPWPPTP